MIRTVQWPTLLVGGTIYGVFFTLTLNWALVPWPLLLVCGGLTAAWFASLEHEVIHGHPTPYAWLNRVLVLPPLMLWLPFSIYAATHQAHHRDEILTDPYDDPESYYLAQARCQALRPWQRRVFAASNTLLGRLTLGVGLAIGVFWMREARRIWQGDLGRCQIWLYHGVLVLALLIYIRLVCAMPIWVYLTCFMLPGTALILLRSYLEHQYAPNPKHRTALVETNWFWRLLYLNNSYHLVHHENPAMAWYELPVEYARRRAHYQDLNGAYVVPGYGHIMRSYALRAKEPVAHPEL